MAALIRSFAIIALCALNLRTVLAAIGAGGGQLESVLGGGAALGAASTLSILLIAIAAPVAVRVTSRTSPRAVIAAALGATVVAHGLLVVSLPATIWIAIVIAGLAAGLIGALMPTVLRALASGSPGAATGVMMAGTSLGLLLASVVVAGSIEQTGSWVFGPAILAVIAAVCFVVWMLSSAPRTLAAGDPRSTERPRLLAAFKVTWVPPLIGYLGVQSLVLFAQIAWLVPTLESLGLTTLTAGQTLGLFTSLQIVTGIAAPIIAQRTRSSGPLLLVAAVLACVGTAALLAATLGLIAPDLAVVGGAAVVLALGHGASFALANYLIAVRSSSTSASVGNAGAVMLVSQAFGALGPLAFGALRDLTGNHAVPWWVLIACCIAQVGFGVALWAILRRTPANASKLAEVSAT